MIDVSYNKEENIIYISRCGEITLEDMINHIKIIDEDFKHLKKLNIIEDTRNSTSKYEITDLPKIIDELNKRMVNFKKVKTAMIVDLPSDTALSIYFEGISKNSEKFYYKTYSTLAAAKSWLSSS